MSTPTTAIATLNSQLDTLVNLVALNAGKDVDAKALVIQELDYLEQLSVSKPEIAQCLPITIAQAVKAVLKNNLTLDPYSGLVYVKTRNVKVKAANGAEEWKKALEITPTCNGLLSIAYQCGKIIDHKNPDVKKDESGKVVSVCFEFQLSNGRWEAREFDESDFYRWQRASHNENGRNKQDASAEKLNYANPNYTNWKGGIDPEFARAKAIRHALKKLGTNPNERFAVKVVPVGFKKIEIDPEAERQVEEEFTNHEEVKTEAPGATFHVTTHEQVTIPEEKL